MSDRIGASMAGCQLSRLHRPRQPEKLAKVVPRSQVLRYAAEYKDPDEPLPDFVVRRGGLNECVARFARRLGRGVRIPVQLKMP
jgi:hypothetical protein